MAENKNAQQVREITDKLEQGIKELFESERFKEYLRTMSKFYNYSFNNTLLIAMQKPEATYVAGYTSWQRNFDRQVMKGEKGIKILAPAPYKTQEEREKIDPVTQKPVIGADGNAVTETVEVLRPAFKVVSVFDVSQTDGKELPDIIVDELKGTVENYEAFFDALKQESPVPISFEDIPGGAKGFFSPVESRIAIQEGMSEIQTVKTAIHEITHAKLHAVKPDEKTAPEDKKDRHTKEVEAESVAYTVCQRYGIETSDYSFGYIAGWSSDKETKELKGSLETIRKSAGEMIEGIDEKLKVLLAEKEAEVECEAEYPPRDEGIPVYRQTASYALEADELDIYHASYDANVACKETIEYAISSHYADNRLAAEAAVTSVLEQFSPERVQYVLANTIQQKAHDGRISEKHKAWASGMEVCPENAAFFVVDQANPGLTNLFITEFQRQMDVREQNALTSEESRDPEVVAWERDEITSFTVKVEEVQSPVASEKTLQSAAAKHKLTPEEKQIKEAVMDTLKARIAHANDGMLATYKSSDQSFRTMMQYKVRIEGNQVIQNGEPLFAIHRRFSSRKTQGCYRELLPKLEYIRQEKAQDTRREKPSIRDQLKAAARSKPEQSTPAKSKKHEMGLE